MVNLEAGIGSQSSQQELDHDALAMVWRRRMGEDKNPTLCCHAP
jgi:hypothetical protein